jgi:uncharacterized protein (DUF433 family)
VEGARVFGVSASAMFCNRLGPGPSFEEILADYPFLEHEDILAALEYAARQTDHIVLQGS